MSGPLNAVDSEENTPESNKPPQEELADEIKNREAANSRLALMEQAIPKLHEDLKRVQEQLVQSRMEVQRSFVPVDAVALPRPAGTAYHLAMHGNG